MKPQANADDLAAQEQRRLNEARNLAAGILNDLQTGEPEGTAAARRRLARLRNTLNTLSDIQAIRTNSRDR